MSDPIDRERTGVAAVVTYIALGQFSFVIICTFALAAWGPKEIDPVMVGILGTIIAAVISTVSGATGYWIGASAGGKTANAALAQLAGAGAQSPAEPGTGIPASDLPTEEPR